MGDIEKPPVSNEEALQLCKSQPKETKDFIMQQTMYRIKDPRKSIPFYTEVLGMQLLTKLDFPTMKFSLYFMGYEDPDNKALQDELSSKDRIAWAMGRKATIELTHNWGTENLDDYKPHNGNQEPKGFGHIGVMVPDVDKACERFEKFGVAFVKKPNDGKMKGIAFITDPDGYWIEIFNNKHDFIMQQTMYRIKDPRKSIPFYTEVLGMQLLTKLDFPTMKFSLYLMGYEDPNDKALQEELNSKERIAWTLSRKATVELTHNWGTENLDDYKPHNGNQEPKGFGHIGLMVPDVDKACKRFENLGVAFVKKPNAGNMKGIAFITDPDGYWIEILNNKHVSQIV